MILLSAMCIVPFILLIMSSITKENVLLKYGYSFWPREISFDAYKTLLVDSGSIVRGYIISALVTVVGTVANLTLTTLFAYPLSRKELPGKASPRRGRGLNLQPEGPPPAKISFHPRQNLL